MASTKRTTPSKPADDSKAAAPAAKAKKPAAETASATAARPVKKADPKPAKAPAAAPVEEKAVPPAAPSVAPAPAPQPGESKTQTVEPEPEAAAAPSPGPSSLPEQAEIDRMIAEAAYYLAEKRNFQPGFEKEDWAVATAEVMARLRGDKPA